MKDFKHDFLDQVEIYEHLSSTMDKAEEFIELSKDKANFLVLAHKQSSGMGRKGNFWFSPSGGLWFTLGLYGFDLKSNFTLFCGIQILKVLEEFYGKSPGEFKIKWPNDIFLNGKKVAGIIVRHLQRYKYYLTGIGLNSNFSGFPPELSGFATSLQEQFKLDIDNYILLNKFLDKLSENLPDYMGDHQIDLDFYEDHDLLAGKKITISTNFAEYNGDYWGVSQEGAILIKLNTGAIQPFYAGQINII